MFVSKIHQKFCIVPLYVYRAHNEFCQVLYKISPVVHDSFKFSIDLYTFKVHSGESLKQQSTETKFVMSSELIIKHVPLMIILHT